MRAWLGEVLLRRLIRRRAGPLSARLRSRSVKRRAHNALADVKQGYDWDLLGAEAEFKRSLQVNPSSPADPRYAECLSRMRKYNESLEESTRALALDPVSAATLTNRGMLF